VEANEHRLRHARGVVDARGARGGAEDRLDAAPVLGVEPVARHEHEHREEAPERVGPGEQPQALALAQVEDAHGGLEQLVVRDLEQLVARVGVEDLEEGLLVVAPWREGGALQHARDAPAQDRDLRGARAVGRVREQPQEHALADADEVEVGGAVDRRAGVGLRERERLRPAREPLGGVLGAGLAQDAEPRLVTGAVAEEGEVVGGEPLHEGGGLGVLVAELRGRLDGLGAHRLPVLDRGAHLADDALEVLLQLAQPLGLGLARHLGMDHGLADRALLERLAGGEDLEQPAAGVAPHRQHGVDGQVHAAPAPVELHADRVDEERHVVGHDLDRGVGGLPPVLLEARVVDTHLRRAGRALAGEVEVAEREAVQVERVALRHVLGRHPAVELARERLGELGIDAVELLAYTRAHRFGQRLLGIFDLHLS
jgi:hypothetical protein